MSDDQTRIPREARTRFGALDSIPLDVIAELFHRTEMPAAIQASFWKAASAKDLHFIIVEKTIRIKTRRDGTKQVNVEGYGSDLKATFEVPDDLTDEQLGELKRAQGARLKVVIWFQVEENGKHPVNSVEVKEADEPPKGGEGEKKEFF